GARPRPPSTGSPRGRTRWRFSWLLSTGREQLADLLVGGRCEVLVPLTDRVEGRRRERAHDLDAERRQLVARRSGADGYRDHAPLGRLAGHRLDGDAHRGPGGEPVVDEDHDPVGEVRPPPALAVPPPPARQLAGLAR